MQKTCVKEQLSNFVKGQFERPTGQRNPEKFKAANTQLKRDFGAPAPK